MVFGSKNARINIPSENSEAKVELLYARVPAGGGIYIVCSGYESEPECEENCVSCIMEWLKKPAEED